MVSAKTLAKQLSVLEIPDGPCIIVYHPAGPFIDETVQRGVCDALTALGKTGWLVTTHPGDSLITLSDEELDRMGLQWKVGLVEKGD